MKIKMGWDLSGAFGDGVGPYCVAESNIALVTQGIAILLSDDQGAGYKVTLPAWEEMYLRICQYRRGQISQNIFNDKWYWDNSDFYHDCSSASVENDEVIICFMTDFEISLTLEAFETLIKNYLKLTKQNPDTDKILEFEIEDAKLISCPEDYQTENTMKVKFYWRQEGLKLVPRTQVFSNQEVKNICVRILFDRDNNGYPSSDINIDEYEKLSIYLKDENSRKQNLINFDELNLNKFKFTEVNFELRMVKIKTFDYIVTMQLNVFITMLEQYMKLLKTGDKHQIIEFEIPEPDVVLIGN